MLNWHAAINTTLYIAAEIDYRIIVNTYKQRTGVNSWDAGYPFRPSPKDLHGTQPFEPRSSSFLPLQFRRLYRLFNVLGL